MTDPVRKMRTPKRREVILHSAQAVFSQKGFDGATTKELAVAAGVSEALLFRHFPTKAALYAAVQKSSCEQEGRGPIDRILALEPSTSSLVFLLYHFMARMALSERHRDPAVRNSMPKLILQSLAGDGEFARVCHERGASMIVAKMEECLAYAVSHGDAVESPGKIKLRCWLAQHLAGMLAFNNLHEPPIVKYGVSRQELAEHAVYFALRGLGVKEEAIQRHYNPKALAMLTG